MKSNTMDSSFESLYSSPSQKLRKESRSPRYLSAWKCLTHGSKKEPLVSKSPWKANKKTASQDTPRSHSWDSWQIMKPRGRTPGMDDYLTLEQLENVWYKQDSYVGCVSVPQIVTEYTFTEAVEAPLIAEHSLDAQQQRLRRPASDINNRPPSAPSPNGTLLIDGTIHPALRPVPYLKDYSKSTPDLGSSNRVAVSVPDTNWTYGRD